MTVDARFLAALWLLAGPAPAAAQNGPVVSAVEVRGSSDPALRGYLTVQVGAPLDSETVRSSVLLLSATDLFDDVSVEREDGEDGACRLIFNVVETPRLGDLRFVRSGEDGGEAPVDPGLARELRRASGLSAGEAFRDKTLRDATDRLVAWLRAHGYPRAAVAIDPLSAPSGDGTALRDLQVRLTDLRQETLVSSRISGWPGALPVPPAPGRRGDILTEDAKEAWMEDLLLDLRKRAYYRAQVKTDSVAGDLVFFVTPGPAYDLKLDLLSPAERAKARDRFAREGLSQDAIEETISATERDFVKRGYRYADVDFRESGTGERTLGEIVVKPGPAFVVGAVEYRIEGKAVPPPGPSLPLGVPWIDAEIDAEKTRLQAELIRQGRASAQVTVEESGEPGNARAIFNIVPGPLSVVGSVTIEGAPAAADRGRNAIVELSTRETAPFRNADVARDRTALLVSLRDDGYVDARVEAVTDFSDDHSRVNVIFQVTPGPRVKVGRILVVGLRDTRETVVRRESRLKEGDYLSYQKLLDTQSGLSATGLFSSVQIREFATAPDERNLIVEVREGIRTTIVPGLGFAETEKLRASVELTKLNLSGLGRSASLFLRGSINGSRALVSLNEPYAFGRRQAVNMQFYRDDDRSRAAFSFRRLGFQTQTVFPLRFGNILAQYTFQKTTTFDVAQDCAEVNRALCDSKVSGPSIGFVHDTRNDAVDPRRGNLYSVETLLSASAFGGDSFLKTTAFAARYDEVRAGTVIAASARLGLSRAFGSSSELPLPERFFAGGPSLMRAFKVDEVGPGTVGSSGAFVPAGGNALLAAAVEARIDAGRYWGVQFFTEIGSVFPRVSEIRLGDLRKVAGLGLHYRSPFGPLRLDWGFKLDRRSGESGQQLHIGVGYAF